MERVSRLVGGGQDNDESCVSMGAVAGEEKYCKGAGSAGE